jgi:flagellar assembly factor FliW
METSTTDHRIRRICKRSPARMQFPVRLGGEVTFPHGIPGFENHTRFQFRLEDSLRPFLFMDSLEDPDLTFVCVDTFYIRDDYEVVLNPVVADCLDIRAFEEAAVLSIVTVGDSAAETTANLMSPLVVNLRTMVGLQVILEASEYPVQFHVWDAVRGGSQQASKAG